ncbi:MAG: hypothetical protein PHF63_06885 [Herbinix sp.]|nr:hypothetical protein [Herbinix sp.]
MNENNLNKMIEKWKKNYKDKADQLQNRSDRKLRIRVKKILVVKKTNDDKCD